MSGMDERFACFWETEGREGWGGWRENSKMGPPPGLSADSQEEQRTRKSIPRPVLPGFLGSHLEDQCPELSSTRAPIPKQWKKGSKETLIFHPRYCKWPHLPHLVFFSTPLRDVSLSVRFMYSFPQMLFCHVFNCILSLTTTFDFFPSRCSSFCWHTCQVSPVCVFLKTPLIKKKKLLHLIFLPCQYICYFHSLSATFLELHIQFQYVSFLSIFYVPPSPCNDQHLYSFLEFFLTLSIPLSTLI